MIMPTQSAEQDHEPVVEAAGDDQADHRADDDAGRAPSPKGVDQSPHPAAVSDLGSEVGHAARVSRSVAGRWAAGWSPPDANAR